jgi:DhnA family fructose-bisphosphate aldolase class Ia
VEWSARVNIIATTVNINTNQLQSHLSLLLNNYIDSIDECHHHHMIIVVAVIYGNK